MSGRASKITLGWLMVLIGICAVELALWRQTEFAITPYLWKAIFCWYNILGAAILWCCSVLGARRPEDRPLLVQYLALLTLYISVLLAIVSFLMLFPAALW